MHEVVKNNNKKETERKQKGLPTKSADLNNMTKNGHKW